MQMVGLTVAVVNMDKMVKFYNAVFNARLRATVHIGDEQFYAGKLCGMKLTFCPNTIAGIVAEQNRQQFRFQVDEIEVVVTKGLANHGSEVNPIEEYKGAKVASLADPDGNTIEFVEVLS
jgi:predicted enzyme related to lactoylglutathione lyase